MENRTKNNMEEIEPKFGGYFTRKEKRDFDEYLQSLQPVGETKKSGKGNYERQARGSYTKHKLEKKANVRHFINKNIDTNKGWENDTNTYRPQGSFHPLYLQITFNRRTTTIKSAIKVSLSIQEYANIANNPRLVRLIAREKDFMEYHFQVVYKAHLDSTTEYFRIFPRFLNSTKKDEINNEVAQNAEKTFDLDKIIKGFSYYNFEIHKQIDYALKNEIIKFAEKLKDNIVKENRKNEILKNELLELLETSYTKSIYQSLHYNEHHYSPNAFQLLSCLELRNPEFKELRVMYPSQIWNFEVFYGFLRNNCDLHYFNLGATMADYLKGDFKDIFLSKFDDDKQKAILIFKDIEKLMEKKLL